MDDLTPQELLKIQRRGTRKGFLAGVIVGVITTSVFNIYTQLKAEKDKNWRGDN